MSTRFLLPGEASGGSMPKVSDPLAAAKGLMSRWLCREGRGGR